MTISTRISPLPKVTCAVRHTGPDGSPIAAGSPFWQLLPALELDADIDTLFDKSRPDAFHGTDLAQQLKAAHVLIVGLGGIGSYAAEFIARAGVGRMTIIDGDDFDASNKNRQLTALDSTLGKNKAVVLAES